MSRPREHFLHFLNRQGRDRSMRRRRSEAELPYRRLAVPGDSAPQNAAPPRQGARRATRPPGPQGSRPAESGFAYLLAMVFVMVMIIGASVAVERGIAQARRQREALTIWRGEQYVRAIRMYYKKTQHYPQTVEDLQKGIANIHFLRPEAYKNPMNKQDGTWRLIYVNPAGQIIGSVRYANLQQMALIVLNNGQMPTMPGVAPAPPAPATPPPTTAAAGDAPGAATDAPQSPDINNSEPQPAPPPQGQPQAPGQPGQSGLFGESGQPGTNPLLLMKPTGPVTGPVVGGFLTGVALAADKPSQKVYEGGKKYLQWEFIWNPLVDQARAIQGGGNGSATGSIGGAGAAGGILGGAGGMNGGGLFPTAPNQTTTPPPQPQQPNQTQQPGSPPQQ